MDQTGPSERAQPDPWWPTVLVFLFFGPPMGVVPLGLLTILATIYGDHPSSMASAFGGGLLMAIFALPFSFILGAIPALLTGVCAAILRRRLLGSVYIASMAAVGGACSAAVGLFLSTGSAFFFGLIGIGPAAVCAWLTQVRGPASA